MDGTERRSLALGDDQRLSYLVWGDPAGDPMVLLHGGAGCALDWWEIAPPFAGDHRIVAPDQRGCGHSDWDPQLRYGAGQFCSDVQALIGDQRLAGCVLVGHSLGAVTACLLAARHPELVRALVLIDGGPRDDLPNPRGVFQAIPAEFSSRDEAQAFLAVSPLSGRGRVGWLYDARFRELDDGRVVWCTDMAGIGRWFAAGGEPIIASLWDEIPRLRCPTLVVRGADSDMFPPDVPPRMAALNDRVRWVEIEDADHGVHYVQPEATVAAIAAFLDDTEA